MDVLYAVDGYSETFDSITGRVSCTHSLSRLQAASTSQHTVTGGVTQPYHTNSAGKLPPNEKWQMLCASLCTVLSGIGFREALFWYSEVDLHNYEMKIKSRPISNEFNKHFLDFLVTPLIQIIHGLTSNNQLQIIRLLNIVNHGIRSRINR